MAYLPPKNPNHWSTPRPPPTTMPASSWVDEFLDFSLARRGLHRRSVSDSLAFYEDPPPPESFDRLDDQQLMSMFSDEAALVSNPSTPSDHNSANENSTDVSVAAAVDEKTEAQSENRQGEGSPTATMAAGVGSDPNVDAKRVKRILANRQSAQRSRVRKLHYISELERSVTTLQSEVSALSPRVAFLDHQRLILNVNNSALKQRIAVLAQDKLFKDAHQEALKKEIERLRMVYQQQNVKKIGTHVDPPVDIGISN